jgi:hypothetical protein
MQCPGHFTPSKETWYPLYMRLDGPQGQSGRVRKISLSTGIQSPDCPARSESVYRLRYPGPRNVKNTSIYFKCIIWSYIYNSTQLFFLRSLQFIAHTKPNLFLCTPQVQVSTFCQGNKLLQALNFFHTH